MMQNRPFAYANQIRKKANFLLSMYRDPFCGKVDKSGNVGRKADGRGSKGTEAMIPDDPILLGTAILVATLALAYWKACQ